MSASPKEPGECAPDGGADGPCILCAGSGVVLDSQPETICSCLAGAALFEECLRK